MPFCRFLSKLPRAGLLRIKKAPQADIQLLKSGCEVHFYCGSALHHSQEALTINKQSHKQQSSTPIGLLNLLVSSHVWLTIILIRLDPTCRSLLAIDQRKHARPCCSTWSGAGFWMAGPGGSLAMLWLWRSLTQLLHHIIAAVYVCYNLALFGVYMCCSVRFAATFCHWICPYRHHAFTR